MSFVTVAVITGLVIAISIFIERFFSLYQIIIKKPLLPKAAVEIDPVEHIYAHPDCTEQLQDHRDFGVKTVYEALLHGLRLGGDRPHFSYRTSSDQPFKSYSHK
jgi:hypothetical protein